jgi:hypothetical protein
MNMMKKSIMIGGLIALVIVMNGCQSQPKTAKISIDILRDKIAGGWAGKMIGVSYGAKSEFRARGETFEKALPWEPSMVDNALGQDDMYVQMSFMMTMDKYGMEAPAEKFAASFANAGYRLWCANVQARKNYWDGIMPPLSGSPEYNLWADAIDFQIEADYIGFMNPGMPQTANKFADKVGHIMNYGDGVYGGMFVAALYAQAYLTDDIPAIVKHALRSIPAESQYAEAIRDVIAVHTKYPKYWRAAWAELELKWGDTDVSGALTPFNIDAKVNGAYIVMGLLYGEGDMAKTLEISTRCGQDSDCNPSNAAAVIGVIKGYSNLDPVWTSGIDPLADSLFIFTDYSFNSVVDNTLKYAKTLIEQNGGVVTADAATINVEEPIAPVVEVAFPKSYPVYRSYVSEGLGWERSNNWEEKKYKDWSTGADRVKLYSDKPGAEMQFTFSGTGVVLLGDWAQDGGKADLYLDGKLHRNIDTYYWWADEGKPGSFLWHVLELQPGEHTVKVVVTGKKKDDATGARIYVRGAVVYTSIDKTTI